MSATRKKQRRTAQRHTAFRRMTGGPQAKNKRKEASRPAPSTGRRSTTALPGWSDLSPKQNTRIRERTGSFLEQVSTGRFLAFLILIAGAFTFYVGHVHATQNLLANLQQTRAENHELHLKYNRLKGAYDRMTGPSLIYERARELGLEESMTYGPVLTMPE